MRHDISTIESYSHDCMGVLGYRVHERTHKHCKKSKNDHANPNLDPMTGKISPDIVFWESWQKWTQMCADVCRCVQKGTAGYMMMVSVKNKSKRDVNSREGHFFDV